MFGTIALWGCFGFIIWLMRADRGFRAYSSPALLVPGFWLAMIGSRPVDFWLGIDTGTSNLEGNPVNLIGYLLPMAAALVILQQRGFSWGTFIWRNRAIVLLYLFYLISAAWSPFPLASIKRLIKDSGCVLMALVVLTEENPFEATRLLFMRVAYVLLPLSVVFIKYFPAIGRSASRAHDTMNNGVAYHKNSLGALLFIFGLIMIWEWFELRRQKPSLQRTIHRRVLMGMALISAWLLSMASCATANLCLILEGILFWLCGRLVKMRRGRRVLIYGLIGLVCMAALDQSLGVSNMVVAALGRNTTLSGRTNIWRVVRERSGNPIIGMGFYSFWDTSRASNAIEEINSQFIKTAHNGYLDAYLDGGFIAVALLAAVILVAGKRTLDKLFEGDLYGRVAFIVWFLAVLYNNSESDYFRLGPLWMTFLLFSMSYPSRYVAPKPELVEESEEPVIDAIGTAST